MATKKVKTLSTVSPPIIALVLDKEETLVHEGWQNRLFDVINSLGCNEQKNDSHEETGLMVKPEHINVAYFNMLRDKLLALIEVFDWVAVCAAWLTSEKIISHLAEVDSRIVAGMPLYLHSQGTDFTDQYRQKICLLEDKIRFYQPLDGSLLHHKFVVFGNYEYEKEVPLAIWTGSYNFSDAAENNLENAVFIQDVSIAQKYYGVFKELYSASSTMCT